MTATPAEELARIRQELDAAVRAREALLAGVAHDLRNPLNTFAMSSGLLKDDLERDDFEPARALALVKRMERAIGRMQALIDDLVEASRIDAKKIELRVRNESAEIIVREAAAAARPLVTEKGATLVEDGVDPALEISVDRARMVQALAKAVAFALKSTGEGGRVHMGAARVDGEVAFHVRGVSPGDPPSSMSAPEEGRGGLALLIARGLVSALGGHFTVDTSDGTRVVLTLPSAT